MPWCGSQLFNSKSFFLQQIHHASLAHEMGHADNDKDIFIAAQQFLDLGKPGAVAIG